MSAEGPLVKDSNTAAAECRHEVKTNLHHLHAHLPHRRAQLWQLDELICRLHDLGRLLKCSGYFDHGCRSAIRSRPLPLRCP